MGPRATEILHYYSFFLKTLTMTSLFNNGNHHQAKVRRLAIDFAKDFIVRNLASPTRIILFGALILSLSLEEVALCVPLAIKSD